MLDENFNNFYLLFFIAQLLDSELVHVVGIKWMMGFESFSNFELELIQF